MSGLSAFLQQVWLMLLAAVLPAIEQVFLRLAGLFATG